MAINQELLDYVRSRLVAGFNEAEIRNNLMDAGWQAGNIDEAIIQSAAELFPQTVRHSFIGKKILLIILVGILVIGATVFGYFYHNQNYNTAVLNSGSLAPDIYSPPSISTA